MSQARAFWKMLDEKHQAELKAKTPDRVKEPPKKPDPEPVPVPEPQPEVQPKPDPDLQAKSDFEKRLQKLAEKVHEIDGNIASKHYGDPPPPDLEQALAEYTKSGPQCLEVAKSTAAKGKFKSANKALDLLDGLLESVTTEFDKAGPGLQDLKDRQQFAADRDSYERRFQPIAKKIQNYKEAIRNKVYGDPPAGEIAKAIEDFEAADKLIGKAILGRKRDFGAAGKALDAYVRHTLEKKDPQKTLKDMVVGQDKAPKREDLLNDPGIKQAAVDQTRFEREDTWKQGELVASAVDNARKKLAFPFGSPLKEMGERIIETMLDPSEKTPLGAAVDAIFDEFLVVGDGADGPDWVALKNDPIVAWCEAVRLKGSSDGLFWKGGSGANANEIGGRVYHESYGNKWVSYDIGLRKRAISNYQFRAPSEWFAELYAAYYLDKLSDGHPDRPWLKKVHDSDPTVVGGA
jgi:hypothetical protein